MSAPDQSEELQQLREQLAALTRRVYELEQVLKTRAPATQLSGASPPQEQATATPPEPRYEPPAPPSHQPVSFAPAPPLAAPEPPLPEFLRQAAQSATKPAARVNASAGISLESRIGGQWLNRIGIVAVLVGLSYFLKLAFENNWIGPATQVLIGIIAGLAILVWSERFRSKGYPAFAYSLKALAIGALYLSLWAASQYYHLVPPPVSFFGMVLVTLIYAGLSLRQSSELLAAYALSSGFLAPVLISTGENHEIALFSYLLLLDLGTVWIVAIRKWQRLLYGSLTGTAALFLAWETGYYTPPQLTRTLIFLAVFFLLYTLIAARENSEILAAIALACGFGAVLPIFPQRGQEIALLTYLAVLDIAVLWLTSSKTWRRLLAGSFAGTAALFFAWSVTYYTEQDLVITLAFATFFFLLYMGAPFLGETPPRQRHHVELIGVALLNAAAYFTACYLMLDHGYRPQLVWLTLVAAALYSVLMRLLRPREQPGTPLFAPLYLAIAIGFVTVAIPLKFGGHWIALGWLAEAAALFWAAHRGANLLLRVLGVAALALGVVRLVGVDSQTHQILIVNPRFGLYLVAIGALALLARIALLEGGDDNRDWAAGAILALNILALIALHFEVMDYFQSAWGQTLSEADARSLHIARDFTYSAVWMVYGSSLMLIGFWKRSAFLRWQAIVLLAGTAAKVFFYDISALERGYRIAAFIVLGAILLAVSFFYQRSRKAVDSG